MLTRRFSRPSRLRKVDVDQIGLRVNHSRFGFKYIAFVARRNNIGSTARNVIESVVAEPSEGAATLRQSFVKGGIEGFWKERLRQFETEPCSKFVPPLAVAYVHARLGHREETIQFLQKAIDEHDHNIGGLKNAVDYDLVIDDPRLRKMIAQVGN